MNLSQWIKGLTYCKINDLTVNKSIETNQGLGLSHLPKPGDFLPRDEKDQFGHLSVNPKFQGKAMTPPSGYAFDQNKVGLDAMRSIGTFVVLKYPNFEAFFF